MTTGTFKSIRWQRLFFNHRFALSFRKLAEAAASRTHQLHRGGRDLFSIVPTGSISGVIPWASMTYLVYAYGFDWFVHA
jgi:hypothetical protein